MRLLAPACNLATLADGRGAIFTWVPAHAIVEFNLIFTVAGTRRGSHFHPEFDEYALVVEGTGVYLQGVPEAEAAARMEQLMAKYPFQLVGPGSCMYFPRNCPHALHAITDLRLVALLSRRWDECVTPVVPVAMELAP
jgi:mannose-6-phosphate isomerase-like protein (cupin superfamily)